MKNAGYAREMLDEGAPNFRDKLLSTEPWSSCFGGAVELIEKMRPLVDNLRRLLESGEVVSTDEIDALFQIHSAAVP